MYLQKYILYFTKYQIEYSFSKNGKINWFKKYKKLFFIINKMSSIPLQQTTYSSTNATVNFVDVQNFYIDLTNRTITVQVNLYYITDYYNPSNETFVQSIPLQFTDSDFDLIFNTYAFYNYNLNLFDLQPATMSMKLSVEDKLKNKKFLYKPVKKIEN